jgi:hypothetical protein
LETRLKLIEKALKEIDVSKQFMGLETNVDSQEEDWTAQHVLEDADQQEHAWETESWVMLNSGKNKYWRIWENKQWSNEEITLR